MTYLPFPEFDPALITIPIGSFDLALRWYALAYIVGLVVGWQVMMRLMKRPTLWPNNKAPMTPAQPEELLTWMILSVIIGGRLGFAFFYQTEYYLANPFEVLKVWQGGMSFHGGFLGVIVGGLLFCWRNKLPMLSVGDAIAFVAPIGIFLGRIANFINGELWGRPTKQPWGMVFPDERANICPPGWEGPCGRHPSQLYEASLEGVLLFVIMCLLIWRFNAFKTPGRIIGVFFTGYGLARFFVEGFRQGDAQFVTADNPFGEIVMGLTMGQILSLPMIIIGSAILLYTRARQTS